MRYFLVSFTLNDRFSLGSIAFEHEGFFSHGEFLQMVIDNNGVESLKITGVTIISIFEFSNKIDYDKYTNQ